MENLELLRAAGNCSAYQVWHACRRLPTLVLDQARQIKFRVMKSFLFKDNKQDNARLESERNESRMHSLFLVTQQTLGVNIPQSGLCTVVVHVAERRGVGLRQEDILADNMFKRINLEFK